MKKQSVAYNLTKSMSFAIIEVKYEVNKYSLLLKCRRWYHVSDTILKN